MTITLNLPPEEQAPMQDAVQRQDEAAMRRILAAALVRGGIVADFGNDGGTFRLGALPADEWGHLARAANTTGKRSLLSFQGVAPWDGTDAQERVNQLRAEWDEQREQPSRSPQNTPVATR